MAKLCRGHVIGVLLGGLLDWLLLWGGSQMEVDYPGRNPTRRGIFAGSFLPAFQRSHDHEHCGSAVL